MKQKTSSISKGIVSFVTIILLLSFILALTLAYESAITVNAVREISIDAKPISISIKEVDNINELSQLNEGWYQIINGYVYYLESFNSYIFLYLRVKNPDEQNGLLVVDAEGDFKFDETFNGLPGTSFVVEKETAENKEEKAENQENENQITGEVTGLERVSGFATKVCYSADVKTQLLICPGSNQAHIDLETRDDGVKVKRTFNGVGTTPTIEWAPKNNPEAFQPGDPPAVVSNKKTYEATLNGKTVQIFGEYGSLQEAQKAVSGINGINLNSVHEQKVPQATGTTYNAIGANGEFLGKVTRPTYDEAFTQAQFLAQMQEKTLQNIELQRFKVSHPSTGDQYFYADNAENAKSQFKIIWNVEPQSVTDVKPGTVLTGSNYFLVDRKTGQKVVAFNNVESKEDAQRLLSNYQSNPLHAGKELQLVNAPTLNELINQNPGVPVEILQNELTLITQQQAVQTGQQIIAPTYYTPNIGGKISYYVNGKKYQTDSEASTAFDKANQDYYKAITEKYGKDELKKPENIGKQLTGEITPDKELLVKDSQGKVYKLKPITDDAGNVQGVNPLQPVGPSYQTLQIIGDVSVVRTIEAKTGKPTEIKITKGGKSATVDEETAKEAMDAKGKGLSVDITHEVSKVPSTRLEGVTEDYKTWCRQNEECKPNFDVNLYEIKFQNDYRAEFNKEPLQLVPSERQVLGNQIILFRDPKTGEVLRRETLSPDYKIGEGTKTTENFRTAYFFEGREITKEEVDKLKLEEKGKVITKSGVDFPISKVTVEREGDKTYSTTYQYETKFDANNQPTRIFEGVKRDTNGNIVGFIYGEGDQKIELETSGTIYLPFQTPTILGTKGDSSLESEAVSRLKQLAHQQFFSNIERVLTEFRGLGYYATLFFDEDSLLAWRDKVDRAFATLYLGTEYISSGLCSTYIDGQDEGVAFAETPQGLAQIGAHIEATRTAAIQTDKGQEFVYKITFAIRNGDFAKDLRAPEQMNFNVVLRGERTANVFKQDQKVERGSTFSRTGRSAIVQESTASYSKVCIVFDEIPLRWKLDNKELCNSIVEAAVEATPLGATTTTTTTGSGGGTDDINDF